MILAVAWRNLWRHARRSGITAAAMGVAVAMCMASIAMNDGSFAMMFELMVERQLGHAQVHHPDYPTTRVLQDTLADVPALTAALEGLGGTEAVAPRLEGFGLAGGAESSTAAMLVGLDPVAEAALMPWPERLDAGTWLDAADDGVVLARGLAETLELGVGDTVVLVTQAADGSLGNALYPVRGIARTGNAAMDRSGVWLPLPALQELLVLPDQAHRLTVLTDDADTIADWVDDARGAVPGDTVEVLSWWESNPATAEMLGTRDVGTVIVLGIVFIAAAFGVVNTMMMSVFERRRELGVLQALGMRPGRMIWLILVESLLLALLAGVAGLILGGMLDAYLVVYGIDLSVGDGEGFEMMGIVFDPIIHGVVRPVGVAAPLVAVVVVSVLASLWPAWQAARVNPVEAIRSE